MSLEFDIDTNSRNISAEMDWLRACIKRRIEATEKNILFDFELLPPPEMDVESSSYAGFISGQTSTLSTPERLMLITSLVPQLNAVFFTEFLSSSSGEHIKTLLALVPLSHKSIVLPSANTVLYIMTGNDLKKRIQYRSLFNDSFLFKKNILKLEKTEEHTPWEYDALLIEQDCCDLLLTGQYTKPVFSSEFPAEEITTNMNSSDLILYKETEEGINQVRLWIKHHKKLYGISDYYRRVKPGARVLFYGEPGTGKTESAAMLGKQTGKTVYKIDLSKVISKYIGETEKNLGKLFDKAENKDWILFFDEGEALFGKRTKNAESANDLHANQQISYLLQRIETFNGLVILNTNFKENIDTAFLRRFDMTIKFYKPGGEALIQVWKNAFPAHYQFEETINWDSIAMHSQYEFSPAEITNIMKYVALVLEEQKIQTISFELLMSGIKNELSKKGMNYTQPATLHSKKKETSITHAPNREAKKITPGYFSESDVQEMTLQELNEHISWMIHNDKVVFYDKIQLINNELIRRKSDSFNKKFK